VRGAIVLALTTVVLALPAYAERADRGKPVNIESDRMTADDAKQVAVFEGRVVMTQGTFTLRADRLTVRQDKDGFQYGVALGAPATFREKRDGVDEWIDGEALRIEYDGKVERLELFEKARVTRDKDEVRGNYISYDSRSEVYRVQSAKVPPDTPSRESRVRAVIQPKKKENSGSGSAPLELNPTPALEGTR
jgi:lipopolysaccharide export system protein LptA